MFKFWINGTWYFLQWESVWSYISFVLKWPQNHLKWPSAAHLVFRGHLGIFPLRRWKTRENHIPKTLLTKRRVWIQFCTHNRECLRTWKPKIGWSCWTSQDIFAWRMGQNKSCSSSYLDVLNYRHSSHRLSYLGLFCVCRSLLIIKQLVWYFCSNRFQAEFNIKLRLRTK